MVENSLLLSIALVGFRLLLLYKKTNVLNPFQEIKIGDFIIRALPTSHDAPDSMGYLFKEINNDETLLYMTDTGFIPERDLNYMKNCDFYLIESNHDPRMLMNSTRSNYLKMRIIGDHGHLSNDDCASALIKLYQTGVHRAILGHLSGENNMEALALETVRQGLRRADIPDGDFALDVAHRGEIGKMYEI